MALKLLSILLFLTFLVQISFVHSDVSAVVGGRKAAKVGTWMPIKDLKAPEVQDIAQFAIREHNNKTKDNLVLQSVDKGSTQTVEGTNYQLDLTAKGKDIDHSTCSNGIGHYRAVVWVKPWLEYRNLTAFEKEKC